MDSAGLDILSILVRLGQGNKYVSSGFHHMWVCLGTKLLMSWLSLKNTWNKRWPDLEGVKDFKDDHREEITEFVQSIPRFQECDEEDVETWIECDAEDCGFQIKNDDEIVTSV
ncbi:uncharacterized protein TNCV_4670731 [Trichonephila clavipes]|nr:uncharacterized protein TNCV_4670731 [Trichonephila clavipes]